MGYYTRYELQVVSGIDYDKDYEEIVSDEVGYHPFDDETKWYSFEKDMKKVSKENPETLFKLSGEGEENGDLWEAYFKNGKMQMCKAIVTYNEFNENELV